MQGRTQRLHAAGQGERADFAITGGYGPFGGAAPFGA